jgi:F-type H+-transporting ATPase subunit b
MESLGIDIKLLIAQAVNFLIVMFLLWKFAYTPVLKMLDERKSKIEKGLSDADEAKQSLAKAEAESKKITDKAFAEADEIIKNAKKTASEESAAILEKSNEQSQRLVENARKEADSLKEKVLREAKKEISGLIVTSLNKIVDDELTASQKDSLAKKRLSELEITPTLRSESRHEIVGKN